ncbi:MAG TPA: TolC family protein [Candidatus Cryptobacteroides sp.]|nr:TolC family protein [Candidatus Cryptobacteroides sp.]
MKRLAFTLLSIFIVINVNAQTLEECRRLAREHYPEIKQYNLISLTEQYNLSNAARGWIPQILIAGQATYQNATTNYPDAFKALLQANGIDAEGLQKEQYRVAVDISQNIWDGGESKVKRAIASAEAAEQRSQVDVNLNQLQSRVDALYFSILLLDERIAQTEAQIGILDSNLSRMIAYYNNGVAMQSDVDAVEAELLTARQMLAQIESSRASYRKILEIFIGQEISSDTLTRPEMTLIADRTIIRPELKLFDALENKIEAQRAAINSSIMPRLSLFAQAYYGYPGLDLFESMSSTKWTPNAIVGVRMYWSISSFYTKKNNFNKLNTALQQVAVQRDVFLFNTQMQITREDGEIARLRKALEDDARIVELRRSVRMAAESKLRNGVINPTDLLQKITEETTAVLNKNMHEIELLQAIYRLKHTLNQ